jgi:hypothetical protein
MNILDAYKASNCGKIRRSSWFKVDHIQHDHDVVPLGQILKDDWEPINESLTFKIIREECVAGETLLVDIHERSRLYLGFDRIGDRLITDQDNLHGCVCWPEKEIKGWKIGGKFTRSEE